LKIFRSFFKKPYRWAVIFSGLLALAFLFVLLDTFVIPKPVTEAVDQTIAASDPETSENSELTQTSVSETAVSETAQPSTEESAAPVPMTPIITDTSYEDDNITVRIETLREYDTTVHIADITVKNAGYFKTAFADNKFGRNITEATSVIAENRGAIFAVNGDYCGFRSEGYVLRNGTLYRENGGRQALIMDTGGDFTFVSEKAITDEILETAWQIWSFGPPLIMNGEVNVTEYSEITGPSLNSNPRTGIGQVEPFHYIAIVSEGRTDDNKGLSLYELAEIFRRCGCTAAYNLDGGGTSTMYFNGKLVNKPTADGKTFKERKVSDIVYIGYE